VEDAVALETLPSQGARHVVPLARLLAHLPRAELDAAAQARFRNGQTLATSMPDGTCAVYADGGDLIGLGEALGGALRPLRLLSATQAADKPEKPCDASGASVKIAGSQK
jgi:hypothetical protein